MFHSSIVLDRFGKSLLGVRTIDGLLPPCLRGHAIHIHIYIYSCVMLLQPSLQHTHEHNRCLEHRFQRWCHAAHPCFIWIDETDLSPVSKGTLSSTGPFSHFHDHFRECRWLVDLLRLSYSSCPTLPSTRKKARLLSNRMVKRTPMKLDKRKLHSQSCATRWLAGACLLGACQPLGFGQALEALNNFETFPVKLVFQVPKACDTASASQSQRSHWSVEGEICVHVRVTFGSAYPVGMLG